MNAFNCQQQLSSITNVNTFYTDAALLNEGSSTALNLWEPISPAFVLMQHLQALNTAPYPTQKEREKEKDYGTKFYGRLARCHNLNHFVENTLHNHTRRPQNVASFFHLLLNVHWQQSATRKAKEKLMYNDQSSSWESLEFWQCFYFDMRKQHVRWLSISNRITLTPPVYIHIYNIYIYRVPHITQTML